MTDIVFDPQIPHGCSAVFSPEDSPEAGAFYATIAASPDDGNLRGEFADWLEERARTEACGRCDGNGVTRCSTIGVEMYGLEAFPTCPACSGSGSVPDRTARLARGYRALGEYGLYAGESKDGERGFWFGNRAGLEHYPDLTNGMFWCVANLLPDLWWRGIIVGMEQRVPPWKFALVRRAAEDAAALAWCAMTDEEREACDRELRGE